VSAVLHRIEALAGEGRYTLTFHAVGGGEQSAVAQVRGAEVSIASASLPEGWEQGSPQLVAAVRAVLALHDSRTVTRPDGTLRDVEGGWDVGLGNVVIGSSGHPECTAHGLMVEASGGLWTCEECGAQGVVS
jgi:hypothetical protein